MLKVGGVILVLGVVGCFTPSVTMSQTTTQTQNTKPAASRFSERESLRERNKKRNPSTLLNRAARTNTTTQAEQITEQSKDKTATGTKTEKPFLSRFGEILIDQTRVPIFVVAQIFSPSVTPSGFAWDARIQLRKLTTQTKSEVCGVVCSSENGTGMIVTTIQSQLHCPIVQACPKGMKSTDFDLHTHVGGVTVVPNEVDQMLGFSKETPNEPNMFSEDDLAKPNGFLVSPDFVLMQDGKTLTIVRMSENEMIRTGLIGNQEEKPQTSTPK